MDERSAFKKIKAGSIFPNEFYRRHLEGQAKLLEKKAESRKIQKEEIKDFRRITRPKINNKRFEVINVTTGKEYSNTFQEIIPNPREARDGDI